MSNSDWDNEPWWERVFAIGRAGIIREARKAGLDGAEAVKAAEAVLAQTQNELRASQGEMTAAMFRVRLISLARSHIAAMLAWKRRVDSRPCGPFYANLAWREKYPEPTS